MTPQEVIWFANHKYGELAYIIETEAEIRLLTVRSKWCIIKDEKRLFGKYTLYHLNHEGDEIYYHRQCTGGSTSFLIYYAYMHDYDSAPYGKDQWEEFKRLWEMYRLGREIEESIAIFNFLSQD